MFRIIFRLEMKVKEVESRLELEQATRSRLEVQFNRYKDALEKAQQETSQTKAKEQTAQDSLKKVQKSLRYESVRQSIFLHMRSYISPQIHLFIFYHFYRELREEYHLLSNRENDNVVKRKDLEQKYTNSESEIQSLKNDLRLALQRIADLQQAMEEGDDDDDDDDSDR